LSETKRTVNCRDVTLPKKLNYLGRRYPLEEENEKKNNYVEKKGKKARKI
jgi:hypothetical protein